MNIPAVSVILPVYNCEKYIAKAIESVLHQSFNDFELIIINDGSSDNTESIILSFSDLRIVYLKNESNSGLIFTLNKAIEIAGGKCIARMDADDICLPTRLEKQKKYLDEHLETAMVATTIGFIDENENNKGIWPLDRKIISHNAIRNKMPFENCIAHPSIMIRAAVLKELKYDQRQINIEDYDLWLRLLSRGHIISKIDEPLLSYRIHNESVTNLYLKKKNFFFKHFKMKRIFLAKEISAGRINGFNLIVIASMLVDLIMGTGKAIKKIFTT